MGEQKKKKKKKSVLNYDEQAGFTVSWLIVHGLLSVLISCIYELLSPFFLNKVKVICILFFFLISIFYSGESE
jgi:hypothetical protein